MSAEKLETRVRQEQIAAATLDVIAARGARAVSVGSVARRLGLVPSAIYRHFASKDEVLEATIELIGSRLAQNVEVARTESTDSIDCLRNLLTRHVELIRNNLGIPRILFSDEILGGSTRRRAKMYAIIRAYLRRVAEIVREGQREGWIRKDRGAEDIAMMFLGLIQPAALLWHLSDGGFDVTRHAERTWGIFSEAIVVSSGAPAGGRRVLQGRRREGRGKREPRKRGESR